ncbi:hypothetical protein BDC45DRAFT_77817 [Circinella umbellata]|nr:hypothetical protein BDC45DRAFT_77817 [Circinella umbellata]
MDQTEWRKPYTTFHDYLHGSNSTLEQTVNNLSTAVNTLKSKVQHYDRIKTVTKFKRSEIISIDDIRYAETEVIGKRLPEIESHLTKVQKGLDALEMEAKAMESKVDEQAEQIKSLERQLQPNISSTEQQRSQRKKPRLNKRNTNSNNNRDNHSQNLQKKRKLLESELASLQTRIDQDKINYEEFKAQRAEEAKKEKEKQEEEKAATSSDRIDDHAPPRTNDQTMTTEDVHTLKQIKTLSKILLPSENSISISQLLDQHIKIDFNNEV